VSLYRDHRRQLTKSCSKERAHVHPATGFGLLGRCLAEIDLMISCPRAVLSNGLGARLIASLISAQTAGLSRSFADFRMIFLTCFPPPRRSFCESGSLAPWRKQSKTYRGASA